MQKAQTLLEPSRLQKFDRLERFADGEPEFRTVSARGFPTPRSPAGQFDPQTDRRRYADLLGVPCDELELREFFYDRDNASADLLGEHYHLDVLVILKSVADDRRLVIRDRQHSQQLWLSTAFQSKPIRPAKIDNFFHHLPLLIHLDGVHAAVGALIAVFTDRGIKRLVQLCQPVPQNASKTNQDGQRDATPLQRVHQLLQIDTATRLLFRMHKQVAVFANRKIALSPACNVVQLRGVGDSPTISGLAHLSSNSSFSDHVTTPSAGKKFGTAAD